MEVIDKSDDPNAIHRWNRFKLEVITKPDYCKNHFSLTIEKWELLETALDVTILDQTFCSLYHRQQNIVIKNTYQINMSVYEN